MKNPVLLFPIFRRRIVMLVLMALGALSARAQVTQPNPTARYYLFHFSGNVLGNATDGKATLQVKLDNQTQLLQFVSDGAGYYWIKPVNQQKYLALSGSWNTYFLTDSTTDASKYAIEKVSASFVRLKCKSNGKYLGTDNTTAGSAAYSDKSGTDSKHYWYISDKAISIPVDTARYLINPNAGFTNTFDGWGISLCWWANMCGKWSDAKIDQLVDWLVSPTGLNYSIFRYNIGGGDDPLNRNCTPHHMGSGKGLRAEMEGFKDSANADYNWSRDAAQRKIMLKIKAKRPDAVFEAFSNSAPYYMTYSGCCAGNTPASADNVKPENYPAFAQYLVDVCRFYKDSFNLEFKTLAPFNEPVTSYWGANGGQEGCHFGTASQMAFLKILAPVLKASGLKTMISSSDETSVPQAVTNIKTFATDGTVLGLIGQVNTHTYTATNQARANLRALSTAYKMPLWMSEVGSGGSGIGGNLALAQKLMDDIRYLRPEAWVDWQYVEEGNDQWCFVQGSFSNQTYQRVKNYYVRQQLSRYFQKGVRFLAVPNDQMLAALSSSGDSLIVVAMNNGAMNVYHQMDLHLFKIDGKPIYCTRTSETENNSVGTDYVLKDSSLTLRLPAYSITTLILPLTGFDLLPKSLLTGTPYLILPRTANLPLRSTAESVSIDSYVNRDSSQLWTLTAGTSGYYIRNLAGRTLTDAGSYNMVASSSSTLSGQLFNLESVGDGYYRILSQQTGNAFDLSGENNAAGTAVGLYTYGASPAASHRQWMFALPTTVRASGSTNSLPASGTNEAFGAVDAGQAITIHQSGDSQVLATIYNLTGNIVFRQETQNSSTRVPVPSGVYIVSFKPLEGGVVHTCKVLVH
jgi:O-glycosyl hydrolase